jgi:hypothetical protein
MTSKKRRVQVTDRVLDIFDSMEALELYSDPWWALNRDLHREMKLHLWEFPAVADYEDNGAADRSRMLKAASDARKQS